MNAKNRKNSTGLAKGWINGQKGCLVLILLIFSLTAMAGPPLICHEVEIGNAKSLPWNGGEWRAVKKDYDLNRLVTETLALLGDETPILVRMETLRRATIYAQWARFDHKVNYQVKDDRVARELIARLVARAQEAERRGVKTKSDALALFDAGYLVECYKQASAASDARIAPQFDGYAWVNKASEKLGRSAELEFALALILADKPERRAEQNAHFKRAVSGAGESSLLARNIVARFQERGHSLNEIRNSLSRS